MAAALPIALDWDEAVEGAFVVFGRIDRIAQLPQARAGEDQVKAKAQQPGMRAAALTWEIGKRHLQDAVALRITFDQGLLNRFEVKRCEPQIVQHLTPIQAKSAGQFADRH